MLIVILFLFQILIAGTLLCVVTSAFPNYPGYNALTEDLVRYYFQLGHFKDEICGFLFLCHNILLSNTTLKRMLKRLGLRRNLVESPLQDVIRKILYLHRIGFTNAGYRTIWKILNAHCDCRATQTTLRNALLVIDPEGVTVRSRRRLRRRIYVNRGPNFLIHIDGYDKLKPFGIAIHGAIDGYSRKLLWLKAGPSNNNPYYVARFFVDHISARDRFPRCIRMDAGTENVVIRDLQTALFACLRETAPPFLVGRSSANQIIERFWGSLRISCTDFWMNYFKDMRDAGILNDSDPLHIECIRFCYLPLIETQLDIFRQTWNVHRIRQQHSSDVPSGVPNVLYYQPE